jgi:hypothetical protein
MTQQQAFTIIKETGLDTNDIFINYLHEGKLPLDAKFMFECIDTIILGTPSAKTTKAKLNRLINFLLSEYQKQYFPA